MFRKWLITLALVMSSPLWAFQEGEMLTDTAKSRLSLDSNKLTIVDFFAEWCVSCRHELPEVNDLYQSLEGTGVTVLGVDVDEEVEVGLAFQKQLGLDFPVVNDPDQELVNEFKPIGMPALYYIYQGQVLKVRFGAINNISQVITADLTEMGVEL
ncbi:TlpA family protein disulfide reductase [Vibrio brasiliensis]|uniref:TlpA family protein disulfide reductase n=1 Tax=Vibrio brasiliensis TaxID=170652 RepID=UPI001EFD1E7D|nr:TlpA disulfide reductase family protein [Vibrio brasiliensis]MCG9784348.1 TlpA family protein disulfide reductase [Vibrio brasiliensis]